MGSDDRSRRRGDGRDERRRSRSRSRDGRRSSRSRSRERRRSHSRSRSRDREHGRHRSSRHSSRSRSRSRGRGRPPPRRSRSRSRDRARYRSRSHERRRGHEGSGPRGQSPTRWQHDRFHSSFRPGGRIHEEEEHPSGRRPDHAWGHARGGAQPSARIAVYASALMAGLDEDLDAEPYSWEASGGGDEHDGGSAEPTPVLRVTGLPEDAREGELQALLAPVGGLREVRLPRDRDSGRPKGYAFLEFVSAEAAAALMGSDWREQTFYGPHRLRYEYARPRPEAGAADWACEACGAANFARRAECYACGRGRTPGARPLLGPADEPPSCILRVAGLGPGADEEALRFVFVPHAPVRDIRLARDRVTGEPRGVAYVQFYGIEDATRALAACVDARLDSQPDQPLRVCYARDRFAADPYRWQAPPPGVVAEAALAHAGWAPKEFGADGEAAAGAAGGGEDDDPLAAWERQQAAEAAAEPGEVQQADQQQQGQAPQQAAQQQQSQQQPDGYDPLAAAAELQAEGAPATAAAGPAGGGGDWLAQQRAAAEAAGFAYDPTSGYMLEPSSGYYFDANTGLYCHPSLQQWGTFDAASGQFVPHDAAAAAAATAAAAAPGFSSAADSALALGSASAYAARHQPPAARHPQHLSLAAQQRHAAEAAQQAQQGPRPRRGAVIGAAAQLDSQGLMEAARREEERLLLLRKQKELEEAKQKRAAERAAAKQHKAAGGGGPAAAATAAAGAKAAAAAPAPVAGVVYESRWAQRHQQQS